MKKKLLMLGSSLATLEILRKARGRGWYTIVTDNLPPERSPGKKAADAYWMISTGDIDLLETRCREEGIGAIFAGISEFNLDQVLLLTGRLGLPCYIEEGTWALARDKRLFKSKCKDHGVPIVPEYELPAPGDEEAWKRISFPVVVKPTDGTGNAGLSICRNRREMIEGVKKAREYGASPDIIIEKYVTGDETWNGYLIAEHEIRYAYTLRAFRQPGYPTFLYLFGTNASDGVEDYLAQVDGPFRALLAESGCRDGIAWVQCIRDAEGNFHALEMAHRMSADSMGDVLGRSIGVNLVDWMLDTALGVRHTADQLPRTNRPPYAGVGCLYYLFADHAGTIAKMSGLDKLDPERFLVEMTVRPGDEVAQYRMMVKIGCYAQSTAEICDLPRYINQVIDIRDAEGRDLIIHFTDYDAVIQGHKGLMLNDDEWSLR